MKIQYLEIVTHEVDAVCERYSLLHNVKFGENDPNLGGARTAELANGGMMGIRAPLRETVFKDSYTLKILLGLYP